MNSLAPESASAAFDHDSASSSTLSMSSSDITSSSLTEINNDNLNDIPGFHDDEFFGPSINSHTDIEPPGRNDSGSEIPQLRRTHITNGYRDGLTAAKETSLQSGFDVGFELGAKAGIRAGWVLGVLGAMGEKKMLDQARVELGIKEVVQVMKVDTESNDDRRSGAYDEEPLTMEDVMVKDEVLDMWEKVARRIVGEAMIVSGAGGEKS